MEGKEPSALMVCTFNTTTINSIDTHHSQATYLNNVKLPTFGSASAVEVFTYF